ncbi:MAG: RHS repeat protein, partial [Coriobacteriia bacterium]|nr:RHS repeat protein [Coriobacteriia bacterium]
GAGEIVGCTISDNSYRGVYAASITGTPALNHNSLYRNGPSGSNNLEAAPLGYGIDARYNYWGRKTGPRPQEHTYANCTPWLWYPHNTPREAQVFGGHTPCGAYGEPINTSTGNFYYSSTDLVLPGVGPAIAVGRTYNHQDASLSGPLGHGWNLDFESFVQSQEDGSAVVVYPGGMRKTFTADGGGGYVAPPGTHETLTPRQGGGFELKSKDGSARLYTSQGWLESVVDRYGVAITYERAADGRILRIEGSGGRYVAFTYSVDRISTVTDSASRSVTYGFDGAGDLTSVTDANGETTRYAYDSDHRVLSVAYPRHPDDPAVVNVYADDKVTTQYDAHGSELTLTYGEGATDMTSNRGFTSRHEFDDLFRLTRAVDDAGNAELRTYNAAGFIDSLTNGRGNTWLFDYDANGNQTSATDPENHQRQAGYDLSNNNVLWTEDEAGTRTTFSYDATGTYLTSIATPVGTTLFDYYGNGLLRHLRSAGATTTFDYDAAGNLTEVIDPLGKASSFDYDAAGRMTSATDALGGTTRFDYDAAGNLLAIIDPLAELFPGERHRVDFTYDAAGNRETFTDALGRTTSYHYDVMDNLAGVTDALEQQTAYTYDANYNLASVTDARSNTTTYTYTPNDLLEALTDPLGNTWRFAYDGAGNLTETLYPDDTRALRTYHADDMLASLSFD